ncbi:MAG: cytidylate kinase [Opitutae bacterium]|nr:cytidylate kinase [Opitutae bacterium]|tara:strand:+ start:821 stop:1483 length:663 start_codon:yes stop_codon:yes gene_type:complete
MSKNKYIIIALDGAAGSGKSTTAKAVCQKFKYIHVDTGLHYRSLCLYFLNKNISADKVCDYLSCNSISMNSVIDDFSVYLSLDGHHFSSEQLRNQEMNKNVSYYARLPELRNLLLNYQRDLCAYGQKSGFSGIIMDGRDIGSVVLPDADLKFFLHADLSIRQQRRSSDGETDSISGRDKLDSTRKTAPLVCPADAISINTGLHTIDHVVDLFSQHILSLG